MSMGVMDCEMFNFFLYDHKPLHYNSIANNNLSERAIEVPIAIHFLLEHGIGKRILEVGNVLVNYEPLLHAHPQIGSIDVVDKFEAHPRVMNIDIMDFDVKYDTIISISTVEHIGQNHYGEQNLDREAPLKAIQKLYNLLHPGGRALITVPYGRLMDLGWLIQFSEDYMNLLTSKYAIPPEAITIDYFKKLDTEIQYQVPRQIWIQCEKEQLADTYFHSPFVFANGIAVILLHKITSDLPLSPELPDSDLSYDKPVVVGDFYFHPFHRPFGSDVNGWMTTASAGFVFYGPYVALEPGTYLFQCRLEVAGQGSFRMDLTADCGTKLLWDLNFTESVQVDHTFHVPAGIRDVEIRLYKHTLEPCRVRVPNLLLKPL
jgi:SAM-dependent methyltransferase